MQIPLAAVCPLLALTAAASPLLADRRLHRLLGGIRFESIDYRHPQTWG